MTFRDALRSKRLLLMDGAMGTELIRRGYVGPTWRANLDAPELVAAIHAEYAAAGAEVSLTNTFLLPEAPDKATTVGPAAVCLARAANPTGYVLGSLTPLDVVGLNALATCIQALAGVDGILLETCADPSAFAAADIVPRIFPDMPVLLSFAFAPDQETLAIASAQRAEASPIAALGVNCGRDQSPAALAQTVALYRAHTTKPLFARPNAGAPIRQGDIWKYPLTAREWAAQTIMLNDQNLAMLGGCCGTTPECIRELGKGLRARSAKFRSRSRPEI